MSKEKLSPKGWKLALQILITILQMISNGIEVEEEPAEKEAQ